MRVGTRARRTRIVARAIEVRSRSGHARPFSTEKRPKRPRVLPLSRTLRAPAPVRLAYALRATGRATPRAPGPTPAHA